ncbi:MAG: GDP-mannose 4,6-dehydratase [Deferribacterales bacterium]
MDSHSKKVLITGIDSFTGKHLSVELEQHGYDIVGCDLTYKEDDNYLRCDITDYSDVLKVIRTFRPDYIIHLAGISFVASAHQDLMYGVNTIGALNVLDACMEDNLNPEKIILPSTSNVYGCPEDDFVDENVPLLPISHYACSKLSMEHMARTYYGQLRIIITRPFNYTGAGQDKKFVIPKIIDHFRAKKTTIELGDVSVIRDFSDVRFVVSAYRKLMESSAHSDVFNICSGNAILLSEIIEYCNQYSGYTINVKTNPKFVRKNDIRRIVGDNSKLISAIGDTDILPISDTVRWMLSS